jgi:hypothetical protein
LDPSLKHTEFTEDEFVALFEGQRRIGKRNPHETYLFSNESSFVGNKWAVLARLLPGRSENMVKNAWYAVVIVIGAETGLTVMKFCV